MKFVVGWSLLQVFIIVLLPLARPVANKGYLEISIVVNKLIENIIEDTI